MHSMVSTERRSLLLRGVLDLCLLSLLREAPVYGYELTERLAGRGLVVSPGSVYPLLARLEKASLVVSERRESRAGPPRKYYSLSDSGEQALATGIAEWRELSESVTRLFDDRTTHSTREETNT